MAVYAYKCPRPECSHEWEVIEAASTHVVGKGQPCPCCGAQGTYKPQRTSFVLQGKGWAKDGYEGKGGQ